MNKITEVPLLAFAKKPRSKSKEWEYISRPADRVDLTRSECRVCPSNQWRTVGHGSELFIRRQVVLQRTPPPSTTLASPFRSLLITFTQIAKRLTEARASRGAGREFAFVDISVAVLALVQGSKSNLIPNLINSFGRSFVPDWEATVAKLVDQDVSKVDWDPYIETNTPADGSLQVGCGTEASLGVDELKHKNYRKVIPPV